ncbi:MAG: SpoIID/LytB domain-containing protein [Oscillospiraceae bacterium]|nr:SpoIID/LytB domain-containing protein [Oscillospiraceae bacterium]
MKNKISLLAFVNQPLPRRAIAEYESVFAAAYGECRFEQFTDSRELFSALAGAFRDSETVVLAASERHYIEIKKLLFDALRTKTASSDRIAEVLEKADEDQCLMPADAQILVTDDGKYSGFIEKSGSQTLVFLPLSDGRCAKVAEELKLVFLPVEKAAESANTTEPDANGAGEPSAEEKYDPEEVVALLKERGLSVAVASSKNSPFVFSVLPYDDESDFGDAIFAQSVDVERQEDESHGEYIAAMAGRARAKSGASVGAAISNVFRNDDEDSKHFMLICIADENKARVFKVFSRKGETTQEFIYACVHRLYSALADYARNGFVMHDVSDDASIIITDGEHPSHHKSAPVRSGKKTALIVASVILIAVLIGTAVTFLVKGYGSQAGASLIGARTPDTTESGTGDIIGVMDDIIFADVEDPNGDTTDEYSSDSTAAQSTDSGKTTGEQTNGTVHGSIAEGSTVLTTVITTKPTTRPSTTEKPTTKPTQKPTETTTRHSSSKTGTFVFTVYGYGHGVGMSQNGASEYARRGWTYKQILLHYYNNPGISLVKDSNLPSTVTYNGKSYSLAEYLGKTAYAEVGPSAPLESIKSQMVAIYTYAKRQNFKMTTSNHAFRESYAGTSSSIENAIKATLGEYLAYYGSPAFTPYFSTAAGKTASSANVWGGSQNSYPYLAGGRTSPEGDVKRTLTISSEELRKKVEAYNAKVDSSKRITLQSDPAQWIKILEHDSARGSSCGYISSMKIGNQTMRGNAFRLNIMGAAVLRSHCFTFTYTPD